jgi:hypothetical protein
VGGDGGEAMEKEGEDVPVDVPAYGRWVPLASQMGGGRGKEGRVMTDLHCMTSSTVLDNVTPNNSGVEDPQYLSDLEFLGKNRPEPGRQP